MNRRHTLSSMLLILAAIAAPGTADDHPNAARGFDPSAAFQSGQLDDVNLYNGNLVVTLPLGQSYSANGALSYQFVLSYNSNVWDSFERRDPEIVTASEAVPTRQTNAGLGWTLSLGNGRIFPPEPKVNEHEFDQPLFVGADGQQNFLHKSDGVFVYEGYQRFRRQGGRYELEHPSGSIELYDLDGRWRSTRDRFGNSVERTNTDVLLWQLWDGHRGHEVHWSLGSPQRATKLRLAKFGGGDPADTTFHYEAMTIVRQGHRLNSCQTVACNEDAQVQVLKRIDLPNQTSYVFTYHQAGPFKGLLASMTLPTGGKVEWAYDTWIFPSDEAPEPPDFMPGPLNTADGVSTRTLTWDTNKVGQWTYTQHYERDGAGPARHRVTVKSPEGNETDHYFSADTASFGYGLPFTRHASPPVAVPGLAKPIFLSRVEFAGSGSGRTKVRSHYVRYESDDFREPFGGAPCKFEHPCHLGRNPRVVDELTEYDDDKKLLSNGTEVPFHRYVRRSRFDGLGHYRESFTGGNFNDGRSRTEKTEYNDGRGNYVFDPEARTLGPGHTFVMPRPDEPWVLGTFSRTERSEGSTPVVATYSFNPATGFLNSTRRHRNGINPANGDFLVVYTPGATGNVARETFSGGTPGVGAVQFTRDHWYHAGSLATSFWVGALGGFKSLDVDIDANTGFASTSRDESGYPTTYEYDALGRLTLEKPGVGLKGDEQRAWTSYCYDRPGQSACRGAQPPGGLARPAVAVRRYLPGATTGTPLTQELYVYDLLGRLTIDAKRMPDGAWSSRETQRNASGWVTFESERGSTAHGTTYVSHDPFGRPLRVRPAEGPHHDVTFAYSGERRMARTTRIATGASGEEGVETVEVYDQLGRLWVVREPANSAGERMDATDIMSTEYAYEPGGQATEVKLSTAEDAPIPGNQLRRFGYDQAGTLLWEDHPETTGSGGTIVGDVRYLAHDALGNVLRRDDGRAGAANELTFDYDAAGRLETITDGAGAPVKSFTYGSANAGSNRALGRMVSASRFATYPVGSALLATEVRTGMVYDGRGGNVSRRELGLLVDGAPSASFRQGFVYDELGNVSAIDYPQCTFGACDDTESALFTDVPLSDPDRSAIETIYASRITSGCSDDPLKFCPSAPLSRGQMAVFLVQASEGELRPNVACQQVFADVPCSDPFAPFINRIHELGITGGCATNPLRFCPTGALPRWQLAILMLAVQEAPGYTPPACTSSPFSDMPCTYHSARWILEASRRGLLRSCGAGKICPDLATNRREMAVAMNVAFELTPASDRAHSRRLRLAYDQGLLTGVEGFASSITYHPNRTVDTVTHTNDRSWIQGRDPHFRPRPLSFTVSGAATLGPYAYDGAGNVTAIGILEGERYRYDRASRLVSGRLSNGATQSYAYDPFGNLTGITTDVDGSGPTAATVRMVPASRATNRLTSTGTNYDAAGNMTRWNTGTTYTFDALDRLTRIVAGTSESLHLYDAFDERFCQVRPPAGGVPRFDRFTLRDLGDRVLRVYEATQFANWTAKDYVYRAGSLLGTVETDGTKRHFHPDHLGTPRLVTDQGGAVVANHHYYPYGEEAFGTPDGEPMKFTGHERDLGNPGSVEDDLDQMHARFYNPRIARFLSVDRLNDWAMASSSWSKYNYTRNNPIKFVDPDGNAPHFAAVAVAAVVAIEVGLTAIDTVSTARTLADPEVSGRDKAMAAVLYGAGLVGPGAGYGQADDIAGAIAKIKSPDGLPEMFKNPPKPPARDVPPQSTTVETVGDLSNDPLSLAEGRRIHEQLQAEFHTNEGIVGHIDNAVSFAEKAIKKVRNWFREGSTRTTTGND